MEDKILKKLIEDAKKGNEKAIESLYNESKNDVYFFCMRILNNHENALDIMQDTFITVFEKLYTLKDYRTFFKWQKVIAINKCKNFLAKNKEVLLSKENEEYDDEYFDMEELDNEFIPHEYIETKEKRDIILSIIDNNLSEVQKMTIMLFYYEEKSIKDISKILECSQGTVKSRLFKARDILKIAIEKYEKKGTKLHSISTISVLSILLRQASRDYTIPNEISNLVLEEIKSKLRINPKDNNEISKEKNSNDKISEKNDTNKTISNSVSKKLVSSCNNVISKVGSIIKGASLPQLIAGGVICTTLVAGGVTTVLGINNNTEKKNNEALTKNIQQIESSTLTSNNKNKIEKETSTITTESITSLALEEDNKDEKKKSNNSEVVESKLNQEGDNPQISNTIECNPEELLKEQIKAQENTKNEIVEEQPKQEIPKQEIPKQETPKPEPAPEPEPTPEPPKQNNPAAGTYNAEMSSWLNQVLINNVIENENVYGMNKFISAIDRGEIPVAGSITIDPIGKRMNGPTAVVGPYYFNTKPEDYQYWGDVFNSTLYHDALYGGRVRVRVFNDGNGGWYVNAYYLVDEDGL